MHGSQKNIEIRGYQKPCEASKYIALAAPRKCSFGSQEMDAEIRVGATTYSQLATKNVSPTAPAETTFNWPKTVT